MTSLILSLILLSPDIEAYQLIENPNRETYPSRAVAIRMDDCYPLREALKRQALKMELMEPKDTVIFDQGFGSSFMGLEVCRQALDAKRKERVVD